MPSERTFSLAPALRQATPLPRCRFLWRTWTTATPASSASSPTTLEPNATVPLALTIPANSLLSGKRFSALWSFTVVAASSENFTAKLYAAKVALSTTPGSNTLLGSSGTVATGGAGTNDGWAEFQGQYSAASGKLTGTVKFFFNNTVVAEVAVSNIITGIVGTTDPVLNFGISATFGTAGATNSVSIPEGGASINF